jgi:hypothetical protein
VLAYVFTSQDVTTALTSVCCPINNIWTSWPISTFSVYERGAIGGHLTCEPISSLTILKFIMMCLNTCLLANRPYITNSVKYTQEVVEKTLQVLAWLIVICTKALTPLHDKGVRFAYCKDIGSCHQHLKSCTVKSTWNSFCYLLFCPNNGRMCYFTTAGTFSWQWKSWHHHFMTVLPISATCDYAHDKKMDQKHSQLCLVQKCTTISERIERY